MGVATVMKSLEPLSHHHVILYAGDFDRLKEIYSRRKATEVIRTLVRNHIIQIEVKRREKDE